MLLSCINLDGFCMLRLLAAMLQMHFPPLARSPFIPLCSRIHNYSLIINAPFVCCTLFRHGASAAHSSKMIYDVLINSIESSSAASLNIIGVTRLIFVCRWLGSLASTFFSSVRTRTKKKENEAATKGASQYVNSMIQKADNKLMSFSDLSLAFLSAKRNGSFNA
jgi:hypothetical protein